MDFSDFRLSQTMLLLNDNGKSDFFWTKCQKSRTARIQHWPFCVVVFTCWPTIYNPAFQSLFLIWNGLLFIIWLSTTSYNTIQHHTTSCNIIQHNTTSYNIIQRHTTSYNVIQTSMLKSPCTQDSKTSNSQQCFPLISLVKSFLALCMSALLNQLY